MKNVTREELPALLETLERLRVSLGGPNGYYWEREEWAALDRVIYAVDDTIRCPPISWPKLP
jgi:hypothetical protein